jgi:hypothetical protein
MYIYVYIYIYIYPLNITGNTDYDCYFRHFQQLLLNNSRKINNTTIKSNNNPLCTYRKPLIAHFHVQNINVHQLRNRKIIKSLK